MNSQACLDLPGVPSRGHQVESREYGLEHHQEQVSAKLNMERYLWHHGYSDLLALFDVRALRSSKISAGFAETIRLYACAKGR
jgi:hypothetical protein